jgi:hypothetical protein
MHSLVDLPPDLAPLADFLAGSLTKVQQIFDDQLRSDLPPVSRLWPRRAATAADVPLRDLVILRAWRPPALRR